jgi:hypothetical protein
LGGQAEQAHGLPFVLRQGHVGQGAGKPAVAVFERVQGHKPEMREACADEAVHAGWCAGKPAEKILQVRV